MESGLWEMALRIMTKNRLPLRAAAVASSCCWWWWCKWWWCSSLNKYSYRPTLFWPSYAVSSLTSEQRALVTIFDTLISLHRPPPQGGVWHHAVFESIYAVYFVTSRRSSSNRQDAVSVARWSSVYCSQSVGSIYLSADGCYLISLGTWCRQEVAGARRPSPWQRQRVSYIIVAAFSRWLIVFQLIVPRAI